MAELTAGARVNAERVKEIFDTEMTAAQINSFINVAHRFIDANLLSQGLAATTLEDIELFLSAHFCSLNDPRTKSENVAGEWSFTVQGETGMYLDATFYGQQAKLLDTTGTLDKIASNPKKATVTILQDVT